MDIEQKYSLELNAIKKYIRNDHIYEIFKKYGFTTYDKVLKKKIFIQLDSNINVYEACFLALCSQIYINNFYVNGNNLNILEIGLAYGTSSIIIANELVLHSQKYQSNISYDIIDKFQSTQWKNIGQNNVESFIGGNKYIKYKLYENYSTKIMPKLILQNNKYDIIFIDGAHDALTVYTDIFFSHKMLRINGIIILDDVLHKGVKKAIKKFLYKYGKYYRRISIDKDLNFSKEYKIYTNDMYKKNFFNPSTMYCFQKKHQ